MDITNTNGGRAGLHPILFKMHLISMKLKRTEKIGKLLADLLSTEPKGVDQKATTAEKEAANEAAGEEYK